MAVFIILVKKLLDHNPDDRVGKSIVQHEVVKHQRAKALVPQMFDHPVVPVAPARPRPVDISKSEFDNLPKQQFHSQMMMSEPMHLHAQQHKMSHHKHKHHSKHKKQK